MKKVIQLVLIGVSVIHQGCLNENGCGECFTPPQPFVFEILDKTTGENLFTNGFYDYNQIEIINEADGSSVSYTFVDESDLDIIELNSIGWQTEEVNLSFKITDKEVFKFFVDAVRVSKNCCEFTIYNEINIENAESELDNDAGVYTVFNEGFENPI